ncbi:hypothetical protein ACFL13_02890 [Patescibacteria group bacterium]
MTTRPLEKEGSNLEKENTEVLIAVQLIIIVMAFGITVFELAGSYGTNTFPSIPILVVFAVTPLHVTLLWSKRGRRALLSIWGVLLILSLIVGLTLNDPFYYVCAGLCFIIKLLMPSKERWY